MKNIIDFRALLLSFIIIISCSSTIPGQTSMSVSQHTAYYSNSFYNSYQLPDLNNNLGLSLQHLIINDARQSHLYYNLNVNTFREYSNRFNHNHEFGYDGIISSKDENYAVYFGLSVSRNLDKEEYKIYDHATSDLYLNMKYYLIENLISRIGYILTKRTYDELPGFSYLEHLFYIRLNTYVQSGTSLSMYINYGLKDYKSADSYSVTTPPIDQLVIYTKIAQSLSSKSSISLSYLTRYKPGLADGQTNVINTSLIFTEDELFDDRYGYSGDEISSQFIYYLPYKVKSEVGIGAIRKRYHHRLVYDQYGESAYFDDVNRSDVRYYSWLNLSRAFNLDNFIHTATAYLSSGYLRNKSNNVYYDFDNLYFGIGIELAIY